MRVKVRWDILIVEWCTITTPGTCYETKTCYEMLQAFVRHVSCATAPLDDGLIAKALSVRNSAKPAPQVDFRAARAKLLSLRASPVLVGGTGRRSRQASKSQHDVSTGTWVCQAVRIAHFSLPAELIQITLSFILVSLKSVSKSPFCIAKDSECRMKRVRL